MTSMVLFGLVLWALFGAELGGTAAGIVDLWNDDLNGIALLVVSVNLAPWTGMAGFGVFASIRNRADRALVRATEVPATPLQPVLARIESSRATGEGPDLPLHLGLTIAPDDRPGYRVEIDTTVNLMDMDDYRVGRIVVAAYDPDRPWRVEILPASAASAAWEERSEWTDRAAHAAIDSAPASTLVLRPAPGVAPGGVHKRWFRVGFSAVVLGLLASVPLFMPQLLP